MIFPAESPLEGACSEVRALHVALNSPVVRQDPLPVGPASAAVALHVGVAGVSVAIRSVRTGQVAFFTTDTTTPLSPQLAVDAALSFAEALGFVFDDDEVAADGTGADTAARFWCELIGEEQVEALVDEQPEANDGTPAGVKSEGMEDTETESEDVDATVREILTAASNTAPDPSAILSKFRWPAGPVEVADAVARKTVCW